MVSDTGDLDAALARTFRVTLSPTRIHAGSVSNTVTMPSS